MLVINSGKSNLFPRPAHGPRKVEVGEGREKTGRNPLKLLEAAKSVISQTNDFNSLRGTSRSDFISQAKFSLRKRNLPAVFGGYDDSKDIGAGLIGVALRN